MIWDKEVVAYHPMNLLEYLEHNIWWAKGDTSLNGEKPFSLRQLLIRPAFIIRRGITYATIHPLLSAYIPLNETIWLMTDFKNRSSRQRKQYRKKQNVT